MRIDGFSSFMLSFDNSEADLLHTIGENISELLNHSFGAGRSFNSAFGFVFTFGILLALTFLNACVIRLSGLFFCLIKLPTTFFVNHFPISAAHHLKSRLNVFNNHDIMSPAHSIAEKDWYIHDGFALLTTICRATASQYTFRSAQYAFLISLNSHGIDDIASSSHCLKSCTNRFNHRLYTSQAFGICDFNIALIT